MCPGALGGLYELVGGEIFEAEAETDGECLFDEGLGARHKAVGVEHGAFGAVGEGVGGEEGLDVESREVAGEGIEAVGGGRAPSGKLLA